jgi:hypothetical protein
MHGCCHRAFPLVLPRFLQKPELTLIQQDEETVMPTKNTPEKSASFETIANGTAVTWHYRSAIGHGTVTGIHKHGTTAANTMYSVKQHDHHPGEPAVVHHSGKALTRAGK